MELEVNCSRCQAKITHECRRWPDTDEEGNRVWRDVERQYHPNPLVHAFVELLLWKPEGGLPQYIVEAMKQSNWYDEGDENAPFFSQAVIYPLLDWKDNGRSFFGHVFGLMRACGFDPHEIKMLAHRIRTAKEAREASGRGGILGTAEMDEVEWMPEPGWTAGLIVQGVGVVEARIAKVFENVRTGGPRGQWDLWVQFEGENGGTCHFRRLLRVARWVKNNTGEKVWPPEPGEVELGG